MTSRRIQATALAVLLAAGGAGGALAQAGGTPAGTLRGNPAGMLRGNPAGTLGRNPAGGQIGIRPGTPDGAIDMPPGTGMPGGQIGIRPGTQNNMQNNTLDRP